MGIMTAALAVTIVAYGWLSWSAYQAYQDLSRFKALQLRTEELRGIIIHLDEVLTMSARMAASTGDLGWERRYRKFEPELDSAIKEAISLAPNPQTLQAAAKTDEANIRLVVMENRAFDLVRKRRSSEAIAVLAGQAYETQKKIYANGMSEFINQLRQQIAVDLDKRQHEAKIAVAASVGTIPSVLFVWIYALSNLRRWRTALFTNIEKRRLIQEELRTTNETLELRVEERTAALSKLNADLQAEIAERKRAEQALRESQERFSSAFGDAPIGMALVGTDGRWLQVNRSLCEIVGYTEQELLATTFQAITYPDDLDADLAQVRRVLGGAIQTYQMEKRYFHKQGRIVWILLNVSLVRDPQGNPLYFIAQIQEITERKRTQEELKKAKESAEAANLAKSEFLASMSHEIRTPMNAIIGMADLLAETPLSDEQRKYVQIFHRAGDNLLNLINDILDLSKVEAAQLELDRTGFDLSDLVEKVTEMLAVRAHEKCLELACHVAPEVPTWLIGDPTRLRQVLVNLLGNAIKFTESGEVILRVDVDTGAPSPAVGAQFIAPSSQPNGTVLQAQEGVMNHAPTTVLRFSVSDTGVGIPPDKLETIFERFTQVDSSTTRKYGGTGLGLTISKRLVELMGGRIWVESKLGFGTTFFFTARLEVQPPTQRSPKFTPVQLRGLRTLVVDDNDTNRLILRELLSAWKAVVTEAATGEEALAELQRAHESAASYELVLLDCRMPGMDGFQVAEAIRAHPGLAGVTMMMLTSDNRKDHIQRSHELGMAGYVVKPIRRTDLLEAVAAAVSCRQSAVSPAQAETPSEPAAAQRALSILLVEDAADNRLLIQSYLKKTPHRLDLADNGAIAVAKVRARGYDLVFMDMQMPVMDGYAATRAIRQWEHEQGRPPVPIIALTAHALKGDEEKSMAAGCTAYLTKPVKKATVLAAVAEYVEQLTR
jgi:PAS domain S-box-containing protein